MPKKKSFEDRIKESEVFIEAGNLKSAISTLVKAKRDDPTKAKAIDLGKSIEGIQNRMDVEPPVTTEKPEEKTEEKPEEELKAEKETEKKKPKEKLIEYKVIRQFRMDDGILHNPGATIELPEGMNPKFMVPLEDIEDE